MASVRIHLLGGFLLEREHRALPPISSMVSRSLFSYLVTHRHRAHSRDLLSGVFWPENSEASARRRLSQALWRISTALEENTTGDGLIRATASDIAFNEKADFWLDVAAFEQHIEDASRLSATIDSTEPSELEAAVTLYRGDFLAGFYDEWTSIERHRLQRKYLDALVRLIVLHKSGAKYERALAFAQRLTLQDPLREEAHRETMRLNFLLGRSTEALRQYEVCEAILAEELGTEPAQETRELRASIAEMREKGERPFAPAADTPLLNASRHLPMVGREPERVSALRRVEETLNGRGSAVLIEGEAGIGKTRFLEELIGDAQWRGLTPLHAVCREEGMLQPLHTISAVLDAGLTPLRAQHLREQLHESALIDMARIVPRLRELLPELPRPVDIGGNEAQRRLHDSIRQSLAAIAELNPHVIFIDDVQWADDASIAILARLAGDLNELGVTVCLSYRSSEARERPQLWKNLLRIDADSHAERIALAPLVLEEAIRLVQGSLGVSAVPSELTDGLQLETGGNPLFILETLRAWHDEARDHTGIEPRSYRLRELVDFPISGGVAQVITRRVGRLDRDTKVLVEAAAVVGRSDHVEILASMSGLSRLSTLRAVEGLIQRGIMRETQGLYEFSHDQIRKVVLDGIDAEQRRNLHHRVARDLEYRQPERIEELAYHFTAAGVAEKAYRYSTESGRKALALAAFDTAVRHFEQAAAWNITDGRYDLLTDWERALNVLGRRRKQHQVLDQLAASAESPAAAAELERRRARLLTHEGEFQKAVVTASNALKELGPSGAASQRGLILQTLGLALSQSGHPHDAIPHLEAAISAFSEDAALEARARCDLGNVLGDSQRYEQAAGQLIAALDRYRDANDAFGIAEASGQLATIRMEMGDVNTAIDLYEEALQAAGNVGYRRGKATNLANLGNALYVRGSISAALDRYEEASALFSAIGDRRGAALLRANWASVRFTILGDDAIEPQIRASLEFFRSVNHEWGEAFCHEHLAAIAHRRRDLALARHHVTVGLDLLRKEGHRWVEVHLRRLGAIIELDDAHLDKAQAHISRARDICTELGLKDVAPTVESLAALVELGAGEVSGSLDHARDATAMLGLGAEQPYLVWYRYFLVAETAGVIDEAHQAITEAGRLLDQVLASVAPSDREAARTTVPEHRVILESRRRYVPSHKTVRLPKTDAPLGRPLGDDDWAELRWTVSDPADFLQARGPARRRFRLERFMEEARSQGRAPRLADLASALDVSVSTIRRDLAVLRTDGHLVVTRGSR